MTLAPERAGTALDETLAAAPDSIGPTDFAWKAKSIVGAVAGFVAIVLAALVLAIPVIYLAGSNPLDAYGALLEGSLGSRQAVAESLISMTPLLFAGLAVAIAFQAGLFNIGAEGQLVIGGLLAGYVGAAWDLPGPMHLAVAIAAGFVGGALWAVIPAVLKAWRGVHEVITTIMMNYVAFSVSQYLVKPGGALVSESQPQATDRVAPDAALPRVWDPTRLHAGIFLALITAGLCWYLLYRTPLGFRFRVVGANPTAAAFTGTSTKRVIVQAMLLSGGLAGLAGAVEVLGVHGRYFDSFSPGYGFDSIAVALLGALNPLGVAAAALFFGMLRAGSIRLQSDAGLTRDMVTVISGLVVACVAAQPLTQRWRRRVARRRFEESGGAGA
jgi:simple sugar transport system permease protein